MRRICSVLLVISGLGCLPDTEGQGRLISDGIPHSTSATDGTNSSTVNVTTGGATSQAGTSSGVVSGVGTSASGGVGSTSEVDSSTEGSTSATAVDNLSETGGNAPTCGDMVVEGDEECEAGVNDGGDAEYCDGFCKRTYRYVFVTSVPFRGDFGGVSKAHERCQALADASELLKGRGLRFRAWLSTSEVLGRGENSPFGDEDWFKAGVPYVLPGPEKLEVAKGFEALKSTLLHAISHSELGEPVVEQCANPMAEKVPCRVWTNTMRNGKSEGGGDCDQWTTQSEGFGGESGYYDRLDEFWANSNYSKCATLGHLYCFEQRSEARG
jgi:hypothetical protein